MVRADKTRQAAVALVGGVIDEGRMLSELGTGEGPLAALSPAERARAQRLALSGLRHVGRVGRLVQG